MSLSPLYEPQSGVLTVQYEPNEKTVLLENPPRFTWIPAQLEHDRYVLQISQSEAFEPTVTQTVQPIPYNLYTPDTAFEAGTYYWRYALLEDNGEHTAWSRVRRFEVPADLPETAAAKQGHAIRRGFCSASKIVAASFGDRSLPCRIVDGPILLRMGCFL